VKTAAQHKRSANKNRYKILYPLEAITSVMQDKIIIRTLDSPKKLF